MGLFNCLRLSYIIEQLKGYHSHICGECRYAIHPWEDKCVRCGAEINWDKVYTAEELEGIRQQKIAERIKYTQILSKHGYRCGILGCDLKPVSTCHVCGFWYCEKHKVDHCHQIG